MTGGTQKKLCRKWEDQEGEYLHKHVTRERRKRWRYIGREGEGGRVVVNFQHRKNPRTTEPKRHNRQPEENREEME